MLEVKYDLKRGYYDPIPEDTHLLTLQHISRLTSAEKALLKSTIIRNKLDISLMESVVSSSQYSHYVIQQLEQFQKERKNQTPNILQMVLGWFIRIFPKWYHAAHFLWRLWCVIARNIFICMGITCSGVNQFVFSHR